MSGISKKPTSKIKKIINNIKKDMEAFIDLIKTDKQNIIDKSNMKNLKSSVNVVIDVSFQNDQLLNHESSIESFIREINVIMISCKQDLIDLNLYDKWIKCYLELSMKISDQKVSFLSKRIVNSISIKSIANELIKCTNDDIIYFEHCRKLDNINKNKNKNNDNIPYAQIKSVLHIIRNDSRKIINNNTESTDDLEIVLTSINTYVKYKFSKSGIHNWNSIYGKLRGYLNEKKPFDIYKIRQSDSIESILNGLKTIIKKTIIDNNERHIKYTQINNNYKQELNNIRQTEKYHTDKRYRINAELIFRRNTNTCRIIVNESILLLSMNYLILIAWRNIKNNKGDDQKQLILLRDLNHSIYNHYKSIIYQNNDLSVKSLQNKNMCFDYQKTFSIGPKWNNLCLSIRNYLYYKNYSFLSKVDNYKTIKCPLKLFVKNNDIIDTINDIVLMTNNIVYRGYLFIKLYALYKHEKNEEIPDVTDFDFISMSIRAITINDSRGANMNNDNKNLLTKLETFYESHFRKIYGDKISAIGLSQILNYAKIEMVLAYKNNIIINYPTYVKNYIYSSIFKMDQEKYNGLNKNKKVEYRKELKKQVVLGCNDIIDGYVSGTHTNMKCCESLKTWIIQHINEFVPNNVNFAKNGIKHEIEHNTMLFFKKMIFMNIELEKINRKMFNCFPLRTKLVPSSITLDTLSIITIFINKNDGNDKQGISKLLKDNLPIFYDNIWSEIVDLDKRSFKWNKQYMFNHQIKTDGISATVSFKHIDMDGLDNVSNQNTNKDYYKYIDKLGESEDGWSNELMKTEMTKMCELYNLVLIDPGKNPDLLHMCNYNDDVEKIKYFKYTTKQRINQLKIIKNRKNLNKFKTQNEINKYEEKLKKVSSKTCSLNKFIEYLKVKKEVDDNIKHHYENPFLRKTRLRTFIDTQRSESKLVNKIKFIYGQDKREIVLIYGDWSRKSQMRGVISTPGIGLKRRLKQDFQIYNIDEFRTSCLDNTTYELNKKAKIKNPKTGMMKELHAVLISQISKNIGGKQVILTRHQNRNRNSSLNMRNIIENYKKEGKRIEEFSRSYKLNDETKNPVSSLILGCALTIPKKVD